MQSKVRFKIGDIEFEAEGDAEVIARERNEFITTLLPLAVDAMTRTITNRHVQQITTLPQSEIVNETSLPQEAEDWSRKSLASFIKEKGAKSNTDFILCAAFFKDKKSSIKSFSSTEAKEYFLEAKKTPPKNVSLPIFHLAKKGHIMESPEKGATLTKYILTSEGEDYVEKLCPRQTKAKKTSSRSRKQQKRTTQ